MRLLETKKTLLKGRYFAGPLLVYVLLLGLTMFLAVCGRARADTPKGDYFCSWSDPPFMGFPFEAMSISGPSVMCEDVVMMYLVPEGSSDGDDCDIDDSTGCSPACSSPTPYCGESVTNEEHNFIWTVDNGAAITCYDPADDNNRYCKIRAGSNNFTVTVKRLEAAPYPDTGGPYN